MTEASLDDQLVAAGLALADAVAVALPEWVVGCVASVLDAYDAAGGVLLPSAGPRAAVLTRADAAGAAAAHEVGEAVRALARTDVDEMRTTPMAIVRQAVVVPTAVLAEAGVPPVERDRFASERFPADVYGLTPGSLALVDPALRAPAAAWGVAKAAAHRARHGAPPSAE